MHDAAADARAGTYPEREAGAERSRADYPGARAEPERGTDYPGTCAEPERGTNGRSDHAGPGADTFGGAEQAGHSPGRARQYLLRLQ